MDRRDRVPSVYEERGEDIRQRFLVDLMLMRLGRWLRLLGQDVALPKEESDAELLLQAKKDSRTIITRDKELSQACPGTGVQCVLIRSTAISDQLLEMAEAGVPMQIDPQRCTQCNGPLERIEHSGGRRWQCMTCSKLYWKGGHWQKMESMLQSIRCRREENSEPSGGAKAIEGHSK
jgi:uncharacterized protein with PIN domain